MRICDLNTGIGRLAEAFSQLKDHWGETKAHWNDDVSRQFEKTHLQEIPAKLQLMLASVQRLSEVLEKAERECEDHPEEM